MNQSLLHPWNVDIREAKKIQERLKKKMVSMPFSQQKFLLAGIDVSFMKSQGETSGAIVVMRFPRLEVVEVSMARIKVEFPYVPGFLTFREAPAIFEAWKKLKNIPDLLIFDGQGMAHPRHFGLACHVGVLMDKPSIGCAKSHLFGNFSEPAREKGAYSHITDPESNERIGAVLRTRTGVSPVYVSPGHRMTLDSAIRNIFAVAPRYRIPEPLRLAHIYSKKGWEQY